MENEIFVERGNYQDKVAQLMTFSHYLYNYLSQYNESTFNNYTGCENRSPSEPHGVERKEEKNILLPINAAVIIISKELLLVWVWFGSFWQEIFQIKCSVIVIGFT